MPAFALTIFTGAFLLFQVQPLIGKYILPWFGGGPGVWTTCMLFFQALLLGGYAYAHLASRLKPRAQVLVHLILVATALALLPITPGDTWKPQSGDRPTLHILALLAACLGLPYFVLSSTGPLIQQWFSRVQPGRSPYRLYALSNTGSLLALVSYPFLVETCLARHRQAAMWGWGLVAYAIGCGVCALRLWRAGETRDTNRDGGTNLASTTLRPTQRLLWLLLPACASVLLLATTNKLCQDITVVPFLWVLPLAIYLLSFIISFDSPRWYCRGPFGAALILAPGALYWAALQGAQWPVWQSVTVYGSALFVCCMACHGEVYRLRPDPSRLTGFYLMIAAGGALGGIFVAVVAPLLFTGYYEFQWGILACALLFLWVCVADRSASPLPPAPRTKLLAQAPPWLALGAVAMALLLWLRRDSYPTMVFASRNFYGVLRVFDERAHDPEQHIRGLMHGRIWHGWQFVDPQRAAQPTLYYSEQSGIGLAMAALPASPRRVGVVGLGIGTLAAYARPGDAFRFYEINPEVTRLAQTNFTCLARCAGQLEVVPGDARLSLDREQPQQFDLLVLDAFSSDAVPAHLLTREAFELYARHLKRSGVIAVHISNPYLDLEPVLLNLAQHFNYRTAVIEMIPTPKQWWLQPSLWVLLSREAAMLDTPEIRDASRPGEPGESKVGLWTDDFTSMFPILKTRDPVEMDAGAAEADIDAATRATEQGQAAEAIALYRAVVQARPNLVVALNNLAWLLATSPEASLRNGPEAVQFAERACRLSRYCAPRLIGTLAAAYAEAGRFSEAIATARKACARAATDPELLTRNRELLKLYEQGQPYREPK